MNSSSVICTCAELRCVIGSLQNPLGEQSLAGTCHRSVKLVSTFIQILSEHSTSKFWLISDIFHLCTPSKGRRSLSYSFLISNPLPNELWQCSHCVLYLFDVLCIAAHLKGRYVSEKRQRRRVATRVLDVSHRPTTVMSTSIDGRQLTHPTQPHLNSSQFSLSRVGFTFGALYSFNEERNDCC